MSERGPRMEVSNINNEQRGHSNLKRANREPEAIIAW